MRITEAQYLEAVKIVKAYRDQIDAILNADKETGIKIADVVNGVLGGRAETAVRNYCRGYEISLDSPLEVFHRVYKSEFLRVRNVGMKSFREFNEVLITKTGKGMI